MLVPPYETGTKRKIVGPIAWAAFLAVIIPGLMKRFQVNPAIASGPLVLALADFSTLLVYFGGATAFMPALK